MAIKSEKINILSLGFGDFIDITQEINGVTQGFNVDNALVNINVISPCATIFLMEADKNLSKDIMELLQTLLPLNKVYNYDNSKDDGNAFSYLRGLLFKNSVTLNYINKNFVLSQNQRIIFADFDNKNSSKEIIVSAIF